MESAMSTDNLESLSKDDLITIIGNLKGELTKLSEDFRKVTNLRLYHLERSHNMYLQYNRRESFEIAGIPTTVTPENLEDEVIEICKEAKVFVNRLPLKKNDIAAVHRLKGDTTIVRVVNRKFSREALYCSKNLRNSKRYGEGTKVYINNSFCPEFKFLFYAIRKASRDRVINHWKIRNGVISIRMDEEGIFHEIGHVLDLENLGVPIPERRTR